MAAAGRAPLAGLRLRDGSAGTIAAGDYLKEHLGSDIVAVEALECPTMLNNGFGEHNIQGIGDKHIPLIHNVMNTDFVVAVSDTATDRLNILFNTEIGHRTSLAAASDVPADARGAELVRAVQHLQRACRHQVRQVRRARPGRRRHDCRDRRGHDVRQRAADVTRQGVSRGFDEVAAGEIFGEHLAIRNVEQYHLAR